MKNIASIIVLVSILMVSCSKSFIEIEPVSSATTDVLYATDKDYFDALVGCYHGLQSPYEDFWQFGDLRGDDAVQNALLKPNQVRLDQFSTDPNDDLLEDTWLSFYQVIYGVNTLLAKIQDADPAVVVHMDTYTAEAKFIRALAYFDLVRIFGDVPMITTPITIEEASKTGREKVDVIYSEVIIKDLLDAESKLPASYSGSDVGRATKGAATALLGSVYLTIHDFANAEAALQKVTTMGYALLNNFNDVFNYMNEHNSEYIFDIEYIDGGFDLGSNFTQIFALEEQNGGADLVNAIDSIYGIQPVVGGGDGSPSDDLFAAFDPADKRLGITAVRGVYDHGGTFIPFPAFGTKSLSLKYMTSLIIPDDSRANWKVIRYADVLLMYAEALNENGKTNEALTYLNQVRQRAGLPGYANLSKDNAREKIYTERRFELYLEGHRWFDLIRTGRAFDVMAKYGMKSYMTVFPIPQRQIDVVNSSVFTQNTGY